MLALKLVEWERDICPRCAYHVASTKDLHEGEVAGGLDTSILLAIGLERRELCLLKVLVSRPLKLVGPSLVAEPVADKIGVASINKNRNLLEDAWDKKVERLHPVTVEQEVAVDVKVAAIIRVDRLNAESLHYVLLVQVLVDGGETWIAQATSLAVYANIVRISACLLVRTDHLVVAIDGGRNTAQPALALVAAGDHGLAPRKGVVHALTLALVQDSIVSTLSAGHWAVVRVLGVGVGQTVADEDGLQVNVAVLVRKDLGREDGDVVACVGLAGDVEVLLGVLRELLEEQGQERVYVLASSGGVADSIAAVRVANVDGLVKENDRGIAVPRVGVVLQLDLIVDGRRAKLEEEAG